MRSSFLALLLVACGAPEHPTAPVVAAPVESATATTIAPEAASTDTVTGCERSAIVFVIDRSGSMSGAPIDGIKKAAAGVADKLDARDCYGVVTFDSAAKVIFPLTRMDTTASAKRAIDGITAGGGTDIASGLEAGAREMNRVAPSPSKTSKPVRAILLFTDGQSPPAGIRETATNLGHAGITVSTIGLGNGIDPVLLREVAEHGNGKSLLVNVPQSLPPMIDAEITRLLAQ